MANEQEGFEVSFNEAMGFWYIIQNELKGSVFHRTSLAEHYQTKEEAEEAAAAMREAS